jgi:phage baseplate assembly protein V
MKHALAQIGRRVSMMVGRAVLSAIDDTAKVQTVQASTLADEVADKVERFQNYGFSSVPLPEAEAVVLSVGGLRSHMICIGVEDRRHRPQGGEPGEVTIYDDQGQVIRLKRDGIEITSAMPVKITAQMVEVTADQVKVTSNDVQLGGAGSAAVARVGDTVANGVITSGSAKVKAA